MKVLVFSPLAAVWRPRLPTLLSVAQTHIDAGDDVLLVNCDRSVRACTANLDDSRAICAYCVKKRDQGLGLLEGPFRRALIEDFIAPETRRALLESRDTLSTLDDLRSLRHEMADIGYAAYSVYAYVARKPVPNLKSRIVRDAIQRLANAGKVVYEATLGAIAAERPDRVVIHHGRGEIDRAVLRACQRAGVDCWIYETAFRLNQLICFRNALPHDIENFKRRVDEQWERGPPNRAEIGAAFFEMRRSGGRKIKADGLELETQDRQFVAKQSPAALPDTWDAGKNNIVIYGSSNDEFIAVSSDYEERIHRSQAEALDRLSRDLSNDDAAHLYFRVHPRQKGVKDDYLNELLELDRSRANVTVISAGSNISSYALLDGAAIVLAFHSTMAIEAAYWGKPSIIISASIYKPMGASYAPTSHEELLALIRSTPPAKDKLPALRFGFYQMTSGFTQPYYGGDLAKGRSGYTFRDDPIRVDGWTRWRYFWSRERQRLKWRSVV
jgi:hypothetical protein